MEEYKIAVTHITDNNNIILKLNEKDRFGRCPLIWAIINDNVEVVKLLIKYALQHQITLIYNKSEIDSNYGKILLQNYEQEKLLKVNKWMNKYKIKCKINKFIYNVNEWINIK